MSTTELPAAIRGNAPERTGGGTVVIEGALSEQRYLAFRLAGEVYAIDILRIREIIEYSAPTGVPMMPASVRGVINLRGAVVPVIDLSIRFGREPSVVGKRSCIVIVEVQHDNMKHILGLLVDGVNAVMEIAAENIEPAPAFGAHIDTEFIEGMARVNGKFIILLDVARTLSLEEMAVIGSMRRIGEV